MSLVVIDELNVVGVSVFPGEANSVLVVNTNGVLSRPHPAEFFETIGRRDSEFLQCGDAVEDRKFHFCAAFQ